MYKTYKGFQGNNLNSEMNLFMSQIYIEANKFNDSLNATKIEVQKIKKYLNGLSDTNQINHSEQYSTKSDLINEIIQSSDKSEKLNTGNDSNDVDGKDDSKKIKDILDYIIAVDKEIEKNRKSK